MTGTQIFENIRIICGRISHAAIRAGRKPEDIKTYCRNKNDKHTTDKRSDRSRVKDIWRKQSAGSKEKIQDARFKMQDSDIQWHLIEHLQKNKAKTALSYSK